jgi:hypothetical protein
LRTHDLEWKCRAHSRAYLKLAASTCQETGSVLPVAQLETSKAVG